MAPMSFTNDPTTYEEVVGNMEWRKAIDREIEFIEKYNNLTLCKLLVCVKKIGVKWIYKTKLNEKGEVDKLKAHLVAKGCSQQQGLDFIEVFAPVARLDIVRVILATTASMGRMVKQIDVESSFLHGEIQ